MRERDLLPGARQPAPHRRAAALRRRDPPHPAAGRPAGGAAPARARSARRRGLPHVGEQPHRRGHGRTAASAARCLHLPPRPRRALGCLRVAARRAPAADRPLDRALSRRWLERARGRARGAACASSAWRSQPASGVEVAARAAGDRRDGARPGARAARRRQPAVDERQHALRRSRTAPPPRRSGDRLRHGRGRSGSAATRRPTRRSRPMARS